MKDLEKNSTNISKAASLFTIAVGCLVLAGWFFNIPSFKSVLPGIVSIKFNTAICFILSGIALYLLDVPAGRQSRKTVASVCSWIVLLAGFLNLSEYIFSWNLGIDELLWKEGPGTIATTFPGRMSLSTSLNFMLLGFIFLALGKRKYHWLIQALLIATIPGCMLVIFNHFFGVSFLNSIPQFTNTGLHTAILFIVLCLGVFYSSPLGYLRLSFQKKIAGFFALVFLVLGIILFAFNKNNEHAADTANWVKHTNEVLLTNRQILSQAQEIETGVRSYIITNDKKFLEPYQKAVKEIFPSLNQLRELTKDNLPQHIRIDKLEHFVWRFMQLRAVFIDLRRQRGLEAVMEQVRKGEAITDSIHSVSDEIQEEENRLLVKHKAENEQSILNSSRIITLFQVITGLLLLSVLLVIYNNTRLRNKAEEDLQKSLKDLSDYKYALNESSIVAVTDQKGIIKQVNDNFCKISKYEREELIGQDHRIFNSGFHPKEFIRDLWVTITNGKVWRGEIKNKAKDGTNYWVDTTIVPFLKEQGKPYQYLAIRSDITQRKALEDEIRQFNQELQKKVEEKTNEVIEKEQQYRFLLQNMREGIQVIGYNWKYLFANTSVVEQSKYSNEELLGRTLMEKYPGIENTELFKVLQRCMKDRSPQVLENEFTFPDGTKGWFELSIQPVPEGLFILSMDITERKTSELKLDEQNKELVFQNEEKEKRAAELIIANKELAFQNDEKEKRAAELIIANKELAVSNTELEHFAYIASHDLQEPLRMVTSFMNLLEKRIDGQLDETNKQYFNFAVDGAERMRKLIQDLLLYSRVGTNKEDFTATDLNEVMQYTTRVLEENIKNNRATITVKPMPVITANKTLIGQLFVNFVSNALKYHGDKEPEIEVGCTEDPDKYIFYVKDNGIGIDPKFFDKIFIIFQRLHNKSEYSGTGIGLAICKKIVEIHKGKIWVESGAVKGSTFYFSIPKQNI